MRKGGFNVYLTKEKPDISLYKSYKSKFPNHKDVETEAYVAHVVGNDISKKMKSSVKGMTAMIVQGFFEGGN